jgi:hypothetical protein
MTGTPITDSYWQIPDNTGKKLDTSETTVSTETVQRERENLSDSVYNNTHGTVKDFMTGLDYGLLLRDIHTKALANAFWSLAHEVHLLRVAMEQEDASI